MNAEEYILTSCQSAQQFSVCLWDSSTLNVRKHYKNGGAVNSKCLAVLGEDYVLGAESGKPLLHLWQLNSQDVTKYPRLLLPEPATCLAVSPKNAYLAVGIGSKIYLWHISSGKLLSIQKRHYQSITCVRFSNDSSFILTCGLDGMVVAYKLSELVNVVTNFQAQDNLGEVKPVYVKTDHSLPIRDLHIGCFGKKSRFATVSSDQTCRLYDIIDGTALLVITFDEPLSSVIFDSPCWNLFVGKESGNITHYNLRSPPRSLTHHIDKTNSVEFKGHQKKIICLDINGLNILASGSEDGFVFIWEINSGQVLKKIEHKTPVTNVKFVFKLHQFTDQHFKPKFVVKGLERVQEWKDNFTISRIQTEDIEPDELIHEEMTIESGTSDGGLIEENRKLRVINKQLYLAAIEISKHYNIDK